VRLFASVDDGWSLLSLVLLLKDFRGYIIDSISVPDRRLAFYVSVVKTLLMLALKFLPGASFEIPATSQNLRIMLLNFLVFLQNINIAYEQLRATHL